MVSEVFSGLAALKSAFDLAKGLKDIDDAARRNAAVIELQQKILDAQQSQAELAEKANALEQELQRLKSWEADKSRYQLKSLAPGVVAFTLRDDMRAPDEPLHLICANCCAAGRKSYLQQPISGQYYDQYKCNGCGEELPVNKGTPPSRSDDYVDDFISARY
jgi:hypothetical protein